MWADWSMADRCQIRYIKQGNVRKTKKTKDEKDKKGEALGVFGADVTGDVCAEVTVVGAAFV
jgi:hypothetical protein